MPQADRNKIKNRLGYLTNAIKRNQRGIEWRSSPEYAKISKIESVVDKQLKEDANELFPNNEIMQQLFCKEQFLSYYGHEMKRLREAFNKNCSVRM